jgi:hypothetical protein
MFAMRSMEIAKVHDMSFLNPTWKGRRSEFSSSRASRAVAFRAWLFTPSTIKELWRIALALAICLVISTAFVALGIWIWIPHLHQ